MLIAKRTTNSEAATMDLASALAMQLRSGDIVALEGPLGAGKTCFVRGLARGLGIDAGLVSSPTFIICQEYERGGNRTGIALAHVDAYRLHGPGDLETIGWDELLAARDTIIAIEWPSRIDDAIPAERRIDVGFAHTGEHRREIEISGPEEVVSRLERING